MPGTGPQCGGAEGDDRHEANCSNRGARRAAEHVRRRGDGRPGARRGRGDGWEFQTELNQTFNIDSCGFPIVLKFDLNNAFGKEFTAPDGSMFLLFNGSLKGTWTNPDNGKSISVNAPGPTKATFSPDGMTITLVGTGPTAVILTPADAAVLGVPPVSVFAGRITATLDADGNIISGSSVGHVLVNFCTALS
jgi:hypothetical protein